MEPAVNGTSTPVPADEVALAGGRSSRPSEAAGINSTRAGENDVERDNPCAACPQNAASRQEPVRGVRDGQRVSKAAAKKMTRARGGADAVLARIRAAQDRGSSYNRALKEIRDGQKKSHWIWYVWPTLAVLRPGTSRPEFLLPDLAAVQAYLLDEVLRQRLEEITVLATEHLQRRAGEPNKIGMSGVPLPVASQLFGSPTDADKFAECMTVFAAASAAANDEASFNLCLNALGALQRGSLHERAVAALGLRAKSVTELRRNASK